MLKVVSKLLLLCVLVGYCASTPTENELTKDPFKPVSPVPLNPEINSIMSALKASNMPFNPYASAMAMQMLMRNSDSVSHIDPSNIPEISRIMCSCEIGMEHEKCLKESEKMESLDEIKTITKKLEKLMNKHVFKSVIVKRSIEDMEDGQEMIANGKDAKHDIKLMLNIYKTIKDMLQINSQKDVETFKTKLMSMPEKQMNLRELINELQIEKESCEHDEQVIECVPGSRLRIIKAAISNKNKFACPAKISKSMLKSDSDETCYEQELTTKLMNATCAGRQSCAISVHRDFLNICKCAEQKYLELTYTCDAVQPEESNTSSSRSKRAIHYRNKPKQEARDKLMRSGGFLGGLYDYGLYGYGIPFYDYYGYGYPFYDYYGLYGYGMPFYDYYGYGYGLPFVGAFTYDYDQGYGGQSGSGNQDDSASVDSTEASMSS